MNRYKFINEDRQHLHTLDQKPLIGTSTATKIIGGDKTGGLIWWASGMAIGKLGWITPKIKDATGKVIGQVSLAERVDSAAVLKAVIEDMSPREYLDLLDEAYKAHDTKKKDSGMKGTDRHEILEIYVKKCITENKGIPLAHDTEEEKGISDFKDWAMKNIKKFLWSELHCFNEELWTGGIADVGWEDMQGRIIAGDFKSSKEAYFDQVVQIAGYDLEITHSGGLTPNGDKIFDLPQPIMGYCVIPFGGETLNPEMFWDVERYKKDFVSATSLHKSLTNFKK